MALSQLALWRNIIYHMVWYILAYYPLQKKKKKKMAFTRFFELMINNFIKLILKVVKYMEFFGTEISIFLMFM